MKCAMEIVAIKQVALRKKEEERIRQELEEQTRIRKMVEESITPTLNYAQTIIDELQRYAENGWSLEWSEYFKIVEGGLYKRVSKFLRYSNGRTSWNTDYNFTPINFEYLTKILTNLCFEVRCYETELYVNSCRKEKFKQIVVSIPKTLPCD